MNGMGARNLHFVLVPLMAQGHTIPAIDMAGLLAEHGALVSVITTPVNAARNKASIDRFKERGLLVRFVELKFPCAEAGLPDGCENLDLIPSVDLFLNFFAATRMFQLPLESYLLGHQPRPSCIISDMCLPWTAEIARRLRIPRLVFHGQSCFSLLCVQNIRKHKLYDSTTVDDDSAFPVPDLPQQIEITKARAPGFFHVPGWEKLHDEALEAESAADGVVLNSFDDLEGWYIGSYQEAIGKKVWAIGPVGLSNRDASSKAARGNKASIDEDKCLSWLDSMKPGSVIYVSFGSLTYTSPSQLIEIGSGLEASGCLFIWVVKEKEMSPEIEKWLVEGFEERTGERSLIIKGWAAQATILSHPAIGGFVTHCGWNSALEGVSAGLPMITWPQFADQHLNEKLIVEVLRVGIAMETKGDVMNVNGSTEVLVKRDAVEKAVRSLMDGGEEAKERRKRAREFGEKAMKAMEEGGSSYENMALLIDNISEHTHTDA